ncbi:MAG TPA: PHB depolymerase family esterase, partial [Polyangia bacterium]|nr:PHB depolymerase family esterase [Polyangia bacterium]
RIVSVFLATMMAVGCSTSDNPPGAGSGSGGNSSGGSGGGGVSGTGGSASGGGAGGSGGDATGTGGAAGSGGAATGTGGSGGSSGEDGGADAVAPRPDVARDAVGGGPSGMRQVARPIGMPYPKNGYYEYLPPGYGDGTPRPLLVFFHGIGENGDGTAGQLGRVLVHGPPKIIRNNQWTADRPFVVLSVQHPGAGCPSAAEVHDFITFAMGQYDVDPKKIFLTGLSCGGRGGWAYLGQFKGEQVLAAALIAADSSAAFTAAGCSLLSTVAIWGFHGTADSPATDSAGMANFMACPQPRKDAKYTLLQGATHQQSWERVYDSPMQLNEVLTWMLAQTRP